MLLKLNARSCKQLCSFLHDDAADSHVFMTMKATQSSLAFVKVTFWWTFENLLLDFQKCRSLSDGFWELPKKLYVKYIIPKVSDVASSDERHHATSNL
ncbi:uncharacterized protein V6R79_016160 [Siganus canaliculatus]